MLVLQHNRVNVIGLDSTTPRWRDATGRKISSAFTIRNARLDVLVLMADADSLGQKAREAMRTGRLPKRAADRALGGRGSGGTCPICGERVRRTQLGFQIEYNRHGPTPGLNRYELHAKCLRAWEQERLKLDESAPAP